MRLLFLLLSVVTVSACKVSKARVIRGDVSGKVVDGSTGFPINGADVYSLADNPGSLTVTAGTGNYFIGGLLAMVHTFRADMTGYISQEIKARIPKESTLSNLNFILLPSAYAADRVIAVLTWGDQPPDLDSHLWVPDGSPSQEISYSNVGNIGGAPWALLDVDDVDGFGPETMAIRFQGGALDYPAGVYRYFVHNYTGSPDLTVSGAQVLVYVDGVLTKTYDVPTTGSGLYWHVFDMQGTTITDVNTLSASPIPSP